MHIFYSFQNHANCSKNINLKKISKYLNMLLQGTERTELAAVVKELVEAEALLSQRIRHIKIADRSEHGWATVAEYETNLRLNRTTKTGLRARAEKEAQKKAARKKLKPAAVTATIGDTPIHSATRATGITVCVMTTYFRNRSIHSMGKAYQMFFTT